MATHPGRFISFEGGEGSGKSTQAKRLHTHLNAHGVPTLLTREPGGEAGAEAIRSLLVEGAGDRWEPTTELLLFLAARYQHYTRVIAPAIARGEWVISDRFHDSSRVYQGIGRGLGKSYYDLLHAAVLGNAAPDITFYLDLPPELGLARSSKRGHHETRFEELDLDFHRAVQEGFLHLVASEPARVRRIDAGNGDPDAVFARLLSVLGELP